MLRRRPLPWLVVLALAVALAGWASVDQEPRRVAPAGSEAAGALPSGEDTAVVRVVDGDTIVVSPRRRVRLIGIDAPESVDPRRSVECFGREASAHAAALLPAGTAVRLVADVQAIDRFGRELAYVYRLEDGLFVNGALVAGGYALPATYPPNVAHSDELAALGRSAREAGAGLWGACGG
jgi:micrococcal nuclease